jgi:hypothetical protein
VNEINPVDHYGNTRARVAIFFSLFSMQRPAATAQQNLYALGNFRR